MAEQGVVELEITGGPSWNVMWREGMTVRDVLELAYDTQDPAAASPSDSGTTGLSSATW